MPSFHVVNLHIATIRTLLVHAPQLHNATNQDIQLIVVFQELAITPARPVLQQVVHLAALAINQDIPYTAANQVLAYILQVAAKVHIVAVVLIAIIQELGPTAVRVAIALTVLQHAHHTHHVYPIAIVH